MGNTKKNEKPQNCTKASKLHILQIELMGNTKKMKSLKIAHFTDRAHGNTK